LQLNGTGGGSYNWSPPTGLNNSSIANPVATLQDNITYLLTVTSTEGCVDTNSINITIFKGSSIYVPTAFTPNNDRLNDVLRPVFIGIKKLGYFTIYNRWGQKVFTTNDMSKGWDGTYVAGTNTFVWFLEAEDVVGKMYKMKRVVVIIR
jgi:gliding motility-associated-like protein